LVEHFPRRSCYRALWSSHGLCCWRRCPVFTWTSPILFRSFVGRGFSRDITEPIRKEL
jgi:hypothetical protein